LRYTISHHENVTAHREDGSTTTAVDESDNGSELSDGVGADEPLIVL